MRSTPRRRLTLVVTALLAAALVAAGVLVSTTVLKARAGAEPTSAPAPIDRPGRQPTGPPEVARWQWVLGEPFDVDSPDHLGTNWRTDDGRPVPPPMVYDIDGFSNDAATVAALHQRGARVVCYIETGGWESYRPDAHLYPPDVLGSAMDGYPDERYVDIRSEAVFERVRERLRMCADKGFDAVEPDIDDSYREDTGFSLTQQDNVEFNRRVAEQAHALGLSIALKNGDDPTFAAANESFVDFAVVEQCFEFDTCSAFEPFHDAGKPVLVAEYELGPEEFCERAIDDGVAAMRMTPDLIGDVTPCR
jgi:hypothetical protein